MPEPVFSLYVPRRLRAAAADPVDDRSEVRGADEASCDAQQPMAEDAPADLIDEARAEDEGDAGSADAAEGVAVATPLQAAIASVQRLADIRNDAVRLAAVACGKALRRGMLLDPAQLARFVDDALSDAQARDGAVVRLNPNDVAAAASPSCDTISDPSLAPGEFAIDTSSGTISGNVEERAALLVLAASHASSGR
jgi:flagellar biosynthesis/type III secretory pathway protein FliH